MELATGGRLGREERAWRGDMGALHHEARARESVVDIFALAVNGRIDLVSEAVVALVALETDVMSGGDAPDGTAIRFVRRFPGTQMIARFDDFDGLGVGKAVILRAKRYLVISLAKLCPPG